MKKLTKQYAEKLLTERLGRRFYNDIGRLVTAKHEASYLLDYLLEKFDDEIEEHKNFDSFVNRVTDDYLDGYATEIDYLSYICPKCRTVWDEMLEDCGHYTATMIKYYRLKNGWSLRELAKRMGYKSHNIIASWENGSRNPTIASLKKLASVFGIKYWQLIYKLV